MLFPSNLKRYVINGKTTLIQIYVWIYVTSGQLVTGVWFLQIFMSNSVPYLVLSRLLNRMGHIFLVAFSCISLTFSSIHHIFIHIWALLITFFFPLWYILLKHGSVIKIFNIRCVQYASLTLATYLIVYCIESFLFCLRVNPIILCRNVKLV